MKRGGGGTIRAYDSVSSHHALRAWHITDFGNRFELGTIKTPLRNSSVFSEKIRTGKGSGKREFSRGGAHEPKGLWERVAV
ncbi:MAG: hypothetical protein AAB652_00595 [Patescibacteria group bacterium]